MSIQICEAAVKDAAVISQIGAKTFIDTYETDGYNAELRTYIDQYFTENNMLKILRTKQSTVFMIEVNTESVGYCRLTNEQSLECVNTQSPLEIEKFYIDRQWHGKGLAQELMVYCEDFARSNDFTGLWLTVWKYNARAIAFYKKLGFKDIGTYYVQIGSGKHENRVMLKKLTATGKLKIKISLV